jgi:hypothetical protein
MSGTCTSRLSLIKTPWLMYANLSVRWMKALDQPMKDASYEFATGDLPLMEIVEKYHDAQLPFKYLLKRINETHMKGVEV